MADRSSIHDISPESGLTPKAKYFDEADDVCLNADGVIRLLDEVEPNDRTRAIKKDYRRRLANLRLSRLDLSPEKMREEALFGALKDQGFRLSFTKITGTMDDD